MNSKHVKELEQKVLSEGQAFVETESKEKSTTKSTTIDLKSYFNSARNQGTCGSCSAFSTAGLTEAYFYKTYKHKPTLSPQQLIDCNTSNNGCDNGNASNAFSYIRTSG